MCGIAGIIEKNGRAASIKKLQSMAGAIAHRGPDDDGFYQKDNVALAHRRLSILDLSQDGHQPMNVGSFWITFNGEIYNYIELRKELGGRFKTKTDTEVILTAYRKWGVDCVKKFNGIFAFAIWDEEKKTLFCARDHLGVKPFYYSIKSGAFYFSSEAKGLLAGGIKARPNDRAIYDYLVRGYYQHDTNESFFDGIHQLPPGHTLLWRDGVISMNSYWDPATKIKDFSTWSDKQVSDHFFKIFKDATKIQLRSDVPVGIQLSGGLDSSALTAMVNHICGGQKNFKLFSFIYGNFPDIEKPFMEAAAKKLGWDLEFITIFSKDMVEAMEEIVWYQDEPFPGLPTFGQHFVAKRCRAENIPVILGGEGGDEIGGGYEYYMGAYFLDMIKKQGAEDALGELSAFGKIRPQNPFQDLEAGLRFLLGALGSYFSSGTSADASSFVSHEALRHDFLNKDYASMEFSQPFESHLSNMQYRDIFHTKLPRIIHSIDRAAMAYGVEHRVPFLDHRLVELGLSLPIRHRIRNGHQRFFIRQAMQSLLPKKVAWAPKRATPSPQREWFKDELRPWVQSILASKSFGQRHYFDQKKVLAKYREYYTAKTTPKNSFHIWQWIHLEIWFRKYFD
ncbi:MAG: asparagine synthase (glutamine-hydrolyzing) [bacterium]|nr:asparagine synthase (glutamine-hydrolyzing) [bacterium]